VQYLIVGVNGGGERKVAEFPAFEEETQRFPAIAWTPDGKSLVVMSAPEDKPSALALASIDNGTVTPITHPPTGFAGDSTPVVAPDGSAVAFVRNSSANNGDIFLCDLSGAAARQLTFNGMSIRGLSWTRDSHDIVFAATLADGWRLWRIPAFGGSPRVVNNAGKRAQYPAIAPSGNAMAYVDTPSVAAVWRAALGNPDAPGDERAILRSSGREWSPVYSPDGRRIADISDQTGNDEVWVSDADGGNRVQVTSMKGPAISRVRWSPEGKTLLFDARGERAQDLYTVPVVAGGKPTRVVVFGWNGSFSRDGKKIYYDSRGQIWKADTNGGNPEPLVKRMGIAQPVESLDGKFVYYRQRRSFSRVPVEGGDEEEEDVIVPEHELMWATTLQLMKTGAYYAEFQRSARTWVVSFYDFATRKSSIVFRMKNIDFGSGHLFSISPDGKYILYPKVDQSQTDLMLISNFR
jgi:Tol biopolymer transport system component